MHIGPLTPPPTKKKKIGLRYSTVPIYYIKCWKIFTFSAALMIGSLKRDSDKLHISHRWRIGCRWRGRGRSTIAALFFPTIAPVVEVWVLVRDHGKIEEGKATAMWWRPGSNWPATVRHLKVGINRSLISIRNRVGERTCIFAFVIPPSWPFHRFRGWRCPEKYFR